jgi:hypothetical protein
MVVTADGFGNFPYTVQGGEFRIIGRSGEGVGADAVKPYPPPLNFSLQVPEGTIDPSVVFLPGNIMVEPFLMGPSQVILGVVQQVAVKGVQPQAIQGSANLVVEKIRMNAVLQTIRVFNDLFKRIPVFLRCWLRA